MSIYIKGMEMPTEDEEIIIRILPNGTVMTEYALPITGVKAIPVPDHGRLIAAFDTVKKLTDEGYYNAAEIVTDMPTIIPADHIGGVNEMVTDKEEAE